MKKALIRSIFPGMCTVFALLLFVVLYVFIIEDILGGYLKWYAAVFGIIFVLPAVVCFVITKETYSGRISVIASVVYTSLSLIIVGYICLVLIFYTAFAFDNTVSDTNDPMDYPEKYKLVEEVQGIFPEEIPTNAENTIFEYCPSSWQGERHMMLMYDTDETEIDAVEESADFRNLWEIDKGDRKKLRILLRSYLNVETSPHDGINAYVINGTDSRDSTIIAVLTMPNTGKIAYIYYID